MGAVGEFDKGIPHLIPKPESCENIRGNVQCLDGIWEFCHKDDIESWHEIEVPSHIGDNLDESRGFCGKYSYRKKVSMLPAWKNCNKILKFEGINGHAKLYVDGEYLTEHWNGFLTWNVDITEICAGKSEILLQIDVDETEDRVGCFYHGGILHSTWLYLLPEAYISMLHVSTVLNETYENAVMIIDYEVEAKIENYEIEGFLIDSSGQRIREGEFCKVVKIENRSDRVEKNISFPVLWDAEHPNLYTLCLRVCKDGEVLETVEKKFGFRQIERRQNQVFVNGKEIKLHGVCRHEVSPFHGRCLTKELIDQDVQLFKEANCNYIRTSHYSPSEYFLEACDRVGIYVEDELGLAFVAKNTAYTQRDPSETQRFLSHFQEAMARDYSHPCVIIWSLCNESFGGYNFDILNRYIHKKDPTRLTKFSYPMTMQLEHEAMDVWSIHYTNQNVDLSEKRDNVSVGIMDGKDIPVIHDEYAHIPCYNREEHRRDPNIRNFWGYSIQRFWDKIWSTKGALGGGIWAGIDETDGSTGGNRQLEWGIIDIWRRRKPEFYLVRKAYSPIVIRTREVIQRENGNITINVENRFCHTNLSETEILWKSEKTQGRIVGPEILPGENGSVLLEDLPNVEKLELIWYDAVGNPVDEYCLSVISEERRQKDILKNFDLKKIEKHWEVRRDKQKTMFIQGESRIVIDEESARIDEGSINGKTILTGGPDLNMSGICLEDWKKEDCQIIAGETPEAILSGWYGNQVKVRFRICFLPDGKINVIYHIDQLNVSMPDCIKLRVSVSEGGLNEIGIGFTCASQMDAISWKRQGQWSVYPEDHIGRNEGTAFRFSRGSLLGKHPQIPWKDEMCSYALNGKYDIAYKGTNDFRSQKENIYRAELFHSFGNGKVTVISDSSHSVRAEIKEPEKLVIPCVDSRIRYTGTWYQMKDCKQGERYREMWSKDPESAAEFSFKGTGIVWYGPVDVVYGYARVYIDGQVMDSKVLQRVNGVDFPGSADGYDKKYHYPVYSIDQLEDDMHTIRIEPLGKGNAESQDTYIAIEKFRVLNGKQEEPVQLWINNACNYPMISWGNYCRPPILIEEGYKNQVTIQLGI